MLRFPNPGSTINNFVAVYTALFERLQGQVVDLDDFVAATVDANLATSSGYMGQEAIARSTRPDRSRDPLYNQLKMYAELFRALGWLHPTEQSALNYTFTLLGHQVVAAGLHYLPLLEETVLGVSYPSHVLTVKGQNDLRPFAFILKLMLACDSVLTRDEMIVGPLNAPSDREPRLVTAMATKIQQLRESPKAIQNALELVSEERQIQINTLKNYTRWPIAIMRDCGWTQKARRRFHRHNSTFEAHELTSYGRTVAQRLMDSADIRVDQVDALPFDEKKALSIQAHYSMLERAEFDLETVNETLSLQKPILNHALDLLKIERHRPLLFSPFQSLSVADIRKIFPTADPSSQKRGSIPEMTGKVTGRGSRDHLFVKPNFIPQTQESEQSNTRLLEEQLRALYYHYKSDAKIAENFRE